MTIEEAAAGVGRSVVYTPEHGPREVGTISSTSSLYVFVQYDGERGTKATPPDALTLEHADAGVQR